MQLDRRRDRERDRRLRPASERLQQAPRRGGPCSARAPRRDERRRRRRGSRRGRAVSTRSAADETRQPKRRMEMKDLERLAEWAKAGGFTLRFDFSPHPDVRIGPWKIVITGPSGEVFTTWDDSIG